MASPAIGALQDLFDAGEGAPLPLPPTLAEFYGALRFPSPGGRPWVFSNFVESLDGVVSLGTPRTGGADISGGSREDRVVMALLRAVADVVIVGAGTLRAFPGHVWTPEAIDADRAADYAHLRAALGKSPAPVTVMVSASGDLDPALPVFSSGRAPVIVVTSAEGARRLANRTIGHDVRVAGLGTTLDARDIQAAIDAPPGSRILLEGGPRLMGSFLAARCVDELFLTVAPQVIGRTKGDAREGFTSEVSFHPDSPRWARLVGAKRRSDLLFLRYAFSPEVLPSGPGE
jgi:riboflavin biosynthesis pyrimidine reductase